MPDGFLSQACPILSNGLAATHLRSKFSELVQRTTRLVTIFDFSDTQTDAVRGVRVINLYPFPSGITPAPVDPNA